MALADPDYIARLQSAIRQLHRCESKYIESVTVSGTFLFFADSTLEKSEVAVFELSGNPHAKRAYAWSSPSGSKAGCIVVLEIPPVTSARTAVEAAVAAQILNRNLR